MVVRLGGEFDLGGYGLRSQEGREEAEEDLALHAANCSTRVGRLAALGWTAEAAVPTLRGLTFDLGYNSAHS